MQTQQPPPLGSPLWDGDPGPHSPAPQVQRCGPPTLSAPQADKPLQGQDSWGGHPHPNHASGVPSTFLGTAPGQPPRLSPGWDVAGATGGTGVVGLMGDPTTTTAQAAPWAAAPTHHWASRRLSHPRGDLCCHPAACRGSAGRVSPLQAVIGLSEAGKSAAADWWPAGAERAAGWMGRTSGERLGSRRPGAVPTAPSSD